MTRKKFTEETEIKLVEDTSVSGKIKPKRVRKSKEVIKDDVSVEVYVKPKKVEKVKEMVVFDDKPDTIVKKSVEKDNNKKAKTSVYPVTPKAHTTKSINKDNVVESKGENYTVKKAAPSVSDGWQVAKRLICKVKPNAETITELVNGELVQYKHKGGVKYSGYATLEDLRLDAESMYNHIRVGYTFRDGAIDTTSFDYYM